ncbi:hypothetical protein DFH06DRAFT_1139515 [Mycena polygramma]|nr:hypothetical protein DFH06DRAFT_1139515 [Mycena polygramma]
MTTLSSESSLNVPSVARPSRERIKFAGNRLLTRLTGLIQSTSRKKITVHCCAGEHLDASDWVVPHVRRAHGFTSKAKNVRAGIRIRAPSPCPTKLTFPLSLDGFRGEAKRALRKCAEITSIALLKSPGRGF